MSPKSSPPSSGPEHDPFQAIADATRRKVLRLLADKEMSVAAIAEHFPLSRTAINKHLQVLLSAGLVSSRRVGRETRYKAEPQPLLAVKQWLFFFEQYWDERLYNLKQFLERGERIDRE